ncbi:MAG: hypothetical protein Q4P36_00485 [Bowdeniella nasicola]|nr:hypothetical protein [Bowdeniella nasicola]
MSEHKRPLTRRELRLQREREAAARGGEPLTRREIRRREREEEARLRAIATGEITMTGEVITAIRGVDGNELTPPRPPHTTGEGAPSRRSLRAELENRTTAESARPGEHDPGGTRAAMVTPPRPRHRTVAPPSTAQGVRVVDHATGQVQTIRPEGYRPPAAGSDDVARALTFDENPDAGPGVDAATSAPSPDRADQAEDTTLPPAVSADDATAAQGPSEAPEADEGVERVSVFAPQPANAVTEEPPPLTRREIRERRKRAEAAQAAAAATREPAAAPELTEVPLPEADVNPVRIDEHPAPATVSGDHRTPEPTQPAADPSVLEIADERDPVPDTGQTAASEDSPPAASCEVEEPVDATEEAEPSPGRSRSSVVREPSHIEHEPALTRNWVKGGAWVVIALVLAVLVYLAYLDTQSDVSSVLFGLADRPITDLTTIPSVNLSL